jgi:hypothetical protein
LVAVAAAADQALPMDHPDCTGRFSRQAVPVFARFDEMSAPAPTQILSRR